MKWTKTYRGRYRMYRRSHGVLGSWVLANDPFWFMIGWPAIIGTIIALLIIG